jgi:hypothetical protein
MAELIINAALRRKLRQKLGTRVNRRAGVKSQPNIHPKPRQRLAKLIEEWARAQAVESTARTR